VQSSQEAATSTTPPLIQTEEWESIIFAVDEVPALVEIKKDWKTKHNVKNITRMNAMGQHAFLGYLREEAAKQGVLVPF